MLGPEVFRKQMYCVKECTCDIVETFWRPIAVVRQPMVIRRIAQSAEIQLYIYVIYLSISYNVTAIPNATGFCEFGCILLR